MDRGLRKYTLHAAISPFEDAKQKQGAYREVFNTKLGAMVLQDILDEAGFFSAYYPDPRKPDNNSQAHFNLGKREVCRAILNTMTLQLKEHETIEDVMTAGIDDYNDDPLTY